MSLDPKLINRAISLATTQQPLLILHVGMAIENLTTPLHFLRPFTYEHVRERAGSLKGIAMSFMTSYKYLFLKAPFESRNFYMVFEFLSAF